MFLVGFNTLNSTLDLKNIAISTKHKSTATHALFGNHIRGAHYSLDQY